MLGEPKIPVTCDNCGVESEFDMTQLAMDGVYDIRNLEEDLRAADWVTVDKKHYCCEDCHESDDFVESEDEDDDD